MVTCSDETRHNFQSDDYVTFSEVEVCKDFKHQSLLLLALLKKVYAGTCLMF